MTAGKPTRLEWPDRIVRGMLALALLAGVAWSMTDGGTQPPFALVALLG